MNIFLFLISFKIFIFILFEFYLRLSNLFIIINFNYKRINKLFKNEYFK